MKYIGLPIARVRRPSGRFLEPQSQQNKKNPPSLLSPLCLTCTCRFCPSELRKVLLFSFRFTPPLLAVSYEHAMFEVHALVGEK